MKAATLQRILSNHKPTDCATQATRLVSCMRALLHNTTRTPLGCKAMPALAITRATASDNGSPLLEQGEKLVDFGNNCLPQHAKCRNMHKGAGKASVRLGAIGCSPSRCWQHPSDAVCSTPALRKPLQVHCIRIRKPKPLHVHIFVRPLLEAGPWSFHDRLPH